MLLPSIIATIQQSPYQRITFRDYMSMALYHPTHGYYNREHQKIGRQGDFYTNSTVGSIYGVVWARRFISAWEEQGIMDATDAPLVILEIGGGNGDFAKAVLDDIRDHFPVIYTRLQYLISEQSEFHRTLQEEKLREHVDRYTILSELEDARKTAIGKPTIVFSNELFDALPVALIRHENDHDLECWVQVTNGQLTMTWLPLEDEHIRQYLATSSLQMPSGYIREVAVEGQQLYTQIASVMDEGFIFTVDYGWTNAELLQPERRDGTLMGYYQHRHVADVLQRPGEIDMTTHVHFDDLMQWGSAHRFETVSFNTQREWLLQEGVLQYLTEHQDPDPFSPVAKQNRAIVQLISPGGMGDTFKVLTQRRLPPA